MKTFKKIVWLIALATCFFLGLWVAQDNTEAVTVVLLGFPVDGLALGLWLVVALLTGLLLGIVASLPLIFQLSRAKKKLVKAQSL